MHDGERIDRRSIALRWLELDPVSRAYSGFIQSMPQASHHSIDVQVAACPKHDFE
jgi:hypothetical protein